MYSFYRLADGELIGQQYFGDHLEVNTPAGCGAIAGQHDHMCRRIDLATGDVVDYQPPHPGDDSLRTWLWDASTKRWVPAKTPKAIAQDVRVERAVRLAACDWVVLRALDSDKKVEAAWRDYRAALRDITKQDDFPHSVKWPGLPAAD